MCSTPDIPNPPPPPKPPQMAKAPAPAYSGRNPVAPTPGMAGRGYAGGGLLTGNAGIANSALNIGRSSLLGG